MDGGGHVMDSQEKVTLELREGSGLHWQRQEVAAGPADEGYKSGRL